MRTSGRGAAVVVGLAAAALALSLVPPARGHAQTASVPADPPPGQDAGRSGSVPPAFVPTPVPPAGSCGGPGRAECTGTAQVPPGFGDPDRGKLALDMYACASCHVIQGVVGRDERTGPPLVRMAERQYIAGTLPNTPDNLVRWILHPQEINPQSAMPDMGVKETYARDMVAYLYSVGGARSGGPATAGQAGAAPPVAGRGSTRPSP